MSEQQTEQTQQKTYAPGEPLGADAPSVETLNYKPCPNCKTGVLYVTNYDPFATYESGQDLGADNQLRSGGSYTVRCGECDYSNSRGLNPEKPQGA